MLNWWGILTSQTGLDGRTNATPDTGHNAFTTEFIPRPMTTVGVIGLGRMGHRMGGRLLEAEFGVVGYDLREAALERLEAAGGERAISAADVARRVDLVLTSLPTPDAVEDAFCGDDGLLAAGVEDLTVLETSTSPPETTRALAEVAAEEGLRVVDAPVSGGTEGAERGTLSFMVGAEESELGALGVEVLDVLGGETYYLGDLGAGHATKLVNNVLSSGHRVLAMEAMGLGTAYGVDPESLFEVITDSSGSSNQFEKRVPRVLNRNFEPGFALDLSKKDVRLALQLSDEIDYPMAVTSQVLQHYKEASAKGWGEEDASAVVKVFEENAGKRVESEREMDETFEGY